MMIMNRQIYLWMIGIIICFIIWKIIIQEHEHSHENLALLKVNIEMMNVTLSNGIPSLYDFRTLIDIQDFAFTINYSTCSADSMVLQPLAIILIISAPLNQTKRRVIRDTWGKVDSRSRVYFLIGKVDSEEIQVQIEKESQNHIDIIQGSFEDIYRNLTYKHIMAFKWFIYNCPNVRYLVKMDDDAFINTRCLFKYLETNAFPKNFILCHMIVNSQVQRWEGAKWYLSRSEYPNDYFPTYCEGASIIYSNDVVTKLYDKAQRTEFFWIDDVHITGTIAQGFNFNITDAGEYYLSTEQVNELVERKTNSSEFILAATSLDEQEMQSLWNVVLYDKNNL